MITNSKILIKNETSNIYSTNDFLLAEPLHQTTFFVVSRPPKFAEQLDTSPSQPWRSTSAFDD